MELNMIKQMERFARQDSTIISLGQGVPSGRAAEFIHRNVITAITNDPTIDQYSDPLGLPELRQKIVRNLKTNGMHYLANEVLISSGAIEAFNATLLSYVSATKNEVVVPVPTYSAYERAVQLASGSMIPLALNEANNWQLNIKQVEQATSDKTAAILLCNPNNPTGSMYDKALLKQICQLAKDRGFLVIIDEVYGNMTYDVASLYTPAQEPAFKKQVVRIVSFSKDFKLTGWRIGFLHSHQSIVDTIVPVHDTLVNCATVVSQHAALAALEVSEVIITSNRISYGHRKQLMQQHLDVLAPWLSYIEPRGGYFFFPKLRIDMTATAFCHDLLQKEKIVCIPGADFGDDDTHIRLCFGRSVADITTAMQRIHHYLVTWHGEASL
jgi:aminotransferase